MDSVKVGLLIRDILTKDENIKRLVGDKVYPLTTTDTTDDYPFIVYRRTSTAPADSKDRRVIAAEVLMEIVAVSDSYAASVDIASSIGDALTGKRLSVDGVKAANIIYEGDDEDYIEGAFAQRLIFKLKIQ